MLSPTNVIASRCGKISSTKWGKEKDDISFCSTTSSIITIKRSNVTVTGSTMADKFQSVQEYVDGLHSITFRSLIGDVGMSLVHVPVAKVAVEGLAKKTDDEIRDLLREALQARKERVAPVRPAAAAEEQAEDDDVPSSIEVSGRDDATAMAAGIQRSDTFSTSESVQQNLHNIVEFSSVFSPNLTIRTGVHGLAAAPPQQQNDAVPAPSAIHYDVAAIGGDDGGAGTGAAAVLPNGASTDPAREEEELVPQGGDEKEEAPTKDGPPPSKKQKKC